jgi:hypothetical protein
MSKQPQKKENYTFDYKFSKEELEDKSKQLALACEERNRLEDDKKSVMSDYKAKIDGKNAEINIVSGHINTGKERLTKTCDVVLDFDNGYKTYYWDGLKVGTEKLTKDDYQLSLEQQD